MEHALVDSGVVCAPGHDQRESLTLLNSWLTSSEVHAFTFLPDLDSFCLMDGDLLNTLSESEAVYRRTVCGIMDVEVDNAFPFGPF